MKNNRKPSFYFVRVHDGADTYEYEYAGFEQAESHLNWELNRGNSASLFAYYWDGTRGREELIR